MPMYNRSRLKKANKAVSLLIDAGLIDEAKSAGVNLSVVLERALKEESARRWLAENADTIAAYNREVEERGVWSDGWRKW
jgi:antitoxin CcdA